MSLKMTFIRFFFALLFFPIVFAPTIYAQSGFTIEQTVKLATRNNERALAARERIQASEARIARARAFFFPTLTVTGVYTRRDRGTERIVGGENITIQSLNALSATATANLTLFDARLFPLYAQVRRTAQADSLDAVNDVRMVSFDAAMAFLLTLTAKHMMEAAERRLEFARRNLDAAKARFDAQLVSVNDVTRADLERATAEREQTNAKNQFDLARLNLGFLLNITFDHELARPDQLLETAATVAMEYTQGVAEARERSPELQAAYARFDAQQAFATEALMRILPSISATAQYRVTNEAGFTGRSSTWFTGATLTWNLFDGGAWIADREERVALTQAAEHNVRQLERRIEVDVQSGIVALQNARAAVQQSRVALEAARKNAGETSELYRQGLASALEAADANVRLFEAEVNHAREENAVAIAYLSFRATIGLYPFDKDETR